jgi:hypothetical protein
MLAALQTPLGAFDGNAPLVRGWSERWFDDGFTEHGESMSQGRSDHVLGITPCLTTKVARSSLPSIFTSLSFARSCILGLRGSIVRNNYNYSTPDHTDRQYHHISQSCANLLNKVMQHHVSDLDIL